MTLVLAISVGVVFGVSVYLFLGHELKALAMGVFLLGHAANLSIIGMSRSPVVTDAETGESYLKAPPIVTDAVRSGDAAKYSLEVIVDPLPQALILTAIVIGFAVMCFLLTLIVQTARSQNTLVVDDLAGR